MESAIHVGIWEGNQVLVLMTGWTLVATQTRDRRKCIKWITSNSNLNSSPVCPSYVHMHARDKMYSPYDAG